MQAPIHTYQHILRVILCMQPACYKQPIWCAAQVAFNMFIPCMLFTKVASTLAAQPHISLLGIPAVVMMQACLRTSLDWFPLKPYTWAVWVFISRGGALILIF